MPENIAGYAEPTFRGAGRARCGFPPAGRRDSLCRAAAALGHLVAPGCRRRLRAGAARCRGGRDDPRRRPDLCRAAGRARPRHQHRRAAARRWPATDAARRGGRAAAGGAGSGACRRSARPGSQCVSALCTRSAPPGTAAPAAASTAASRSTSGSTAGEEGGPVLDAAGGLVGISTLGPRRRVLVIPAATVERVLDPLLADRPRRARLARCRGAAGAGAGSAARRSRPSRLGMMVIGVTRTDRRRRPGC